MEYSIKPVKVVQPIALEIVFSSTQEAQELAAAIRNGAGKIKQHDCSTDDLARANSLLHLAKYIESIVVD